MTGMSSLSARSVTASGGPVIAVLRAGCDKSRGQLIDRVGINTYFGSVNILDTLSCEYVGRSAFSVNIPSIEHDQPIAILGS
jgi:hypothetical protein